MTAMERLTVFCAVAIISVMVYVAYELLFKDNWPATVSFAETDKSQEKQEARKDCRVVYKFDGNGGSIRSESCTVTQKK